MTCPGMNRSKTLKDLGGQYMGKEPSPRIRKQDNPLMDECHCPKQEIKKINS